MAWQLIYTSSARLLEAGRTGFGTVAKHRDIGTLLTGKLESISQFARLQGYDPARVIYSHRILEAGARQFHVLSSIRSAGSDYSGRTNHIAHHLVVTEEEARTLAQRLVTPADVLWSMDWRSEWQGASRYLEKSEEVDLSQIQAHTFDVWQRLTANPDHARLPWSEAACKGCCLIVPQDMDARWIVGEAMMTQPAKAWEITLTSNLEPNDGLSDFRWVVLNPDSQARLQVEQSNRPVFDLLRPAMLPSPPAPIRQTASVAVLRQPAQLPMPTPPPPTGLDIASQWGVEKLASSPSSRKAVPPMPLKAGRKAVSPTFASPRQFPWVALIIVFLGFTVAGAGGWMWLLNKELNSKKASLTRATLTVFVENRLSAKEWENYKKKLKESIDQADKSNLEERKAAIDNLVVFLKSVDDYLFGRTNRIVLLSDALDVAVQVQEYARKWKDTQSALNESLTTWEQVNRNLDEGMAAMAGLVRLMPKSKDLLDERLRHIQSIVQNLLKDGKINDEVRDYRQALKAFQTLNLMNDANDDVFDCWGQLAALKKGERLGQNDFNKWNKKMSALPAWLQARLREAKPPMAGDQPTLKVSPPVTIAKANQSEMSVISVEKKAKDLPSKSPVKTFIALITKDKTVVCPKIPLSKDVSLRLARIDDRQKAENFEKLIQSSDYKLTAKLSRLDINNQSFIFNEGKLTSTPTAKVDKITNLLGDSKAYAILGASPQVGEFQLLIVRIDEKIQFLVDTTIDGIIDGPNNSQFKIKLNPAVGQVTWPEELAQVSYSLRPEFELTTAKDIGVTNISADGDSLVIEAKSDQTHIVAIQSEKTTKGRAKTALTTEIANLEEELKDLPFDKNYKNQSPEQQAQSRQFINDGITRRKTDLEQINTRLSEIEALLNQPPPKPEKPKFGLYTLVAQVKIDSAIHYFRVCSINIK